jgi:hypothetical protein
MGAGGWFQAEPVLGGGGGGMGAGFHTLVGVPPPRSVTQTLFLQTLPKLVQSASEEQQASR